MKFLSSKYGKISSVILGAGGLSFLIYLLNRWANPKPKPNNVEYGSKSRPFFLRELHSGYRAWNRLATETYKEDPALDSAKALQNELQKDQPDLMILQQNVEMLENSENEEEAEKILRPALRKVGDKPHEAYEIEMLLVEVLIYKGGKLDLEAALKCKCLGDESLKDARRPLFKAIIYKMQGNIEKAKEYWNEFIIVRDPVFCRQIDFDEFTHHVERLQLANARQMEKERSHSLPDIIHEDIPYGPIDS